MHENEKVTQMDLVYHVMDYTLKGTVDAASRGAFRSKSVEEATQLIEQIEKNNYKAPYETSGSRSRLRGGIIELNKMSAIEAKLDTIMNNQERKGNSNNEVGLVEGAR